MIIKVCHRRPWQSVQSYLIQVWHHLLRKAAVSSFEPQFSDPPIQSLCLNETRWGFLGLFNVRQIWSNQSFLAAVTQKETTLNVRWYWANNRKLLDWLCCRVFSVHSRAPHWLLGRLCDIPVVGPLTCEGSSVHRGHVQYGVMPYVTALSHPYLSNIHRHHHALTTFTKSPFSIPSLHL